MCSTEGQGVLAVRWTDCEPPYGGGVMRIRIRTRDTWSIGRNSLDYRRLWDIVHDYYNYVTRIENGRSGSYMDPPKRCWASLGAS